MRRLFTRLRPGGAVALALGALLAVFIGVGVGLGRLMENNSGVIERDRRVLDWFIRRRQPGITTVARYVTALGASQVLLVIVVGVGVISWQRTQSWRTLLTLAASLGGARALFTIVKVVIGRPRPTSAFSLGRYSGYAFPSGHASQAAAVYFTLAVLVSMGTNRRITKAGAWTVAAFTVTAVGCTRLYLGAHWLTDVLAGWALGTLWCATVLAVIRAVQNVHRSVVPAASEQASAT